MPILLVSHKVEKPIESAFFIFKERDDANVRPLHRQELYSAITVQTEENTEDFIEDFFEDEYDEDESEELEIGGMSL